MCLSMIGSCLHLFCSSLKLLSWTMNCSNTPTVGETTGSWLNTELHKGNFCLLFRLYCFLPCLGSWTKSPLSRITGLPVLVNVCFTLQETTQNHIGFLMTTCKQHDMFNGCETFSSYLAHRGLMEVDDSCITKFLHVWTLRSLALNFIVNILK